MKTPAISLRHLFTRIPLDTPVKPAESCVHEWESNVFVTVRTHDHAVDKEEWEWILKNPLLDFSVVRSEKIHFHNLVTNVGKNMMRDLLQDTIADGKIRYLGVGTSNAAVDATHTQLTAENGRKILTKFTIGTTGKIVSTFYLAPFEFNIAIAELGWFAGPSASSTANSGIMISRVLYSKTKTDAESIQVDREDTFS